MNKQTNKTLNLLVSLALALPSGLFSPAPAPNSDILGATDSGPSQAVAVSVASASRISAVTVLPAAGQVVFSGPGLKPALGEHCLNTILGNAPAPQDSVLINLNQPADCFSLKAAAPKPLTELKVLPMASSVRPVAIVVQNSYFQSFRINSAFPAAETAVLVYFLILLAAAFALSLESFRRRAATAISSVRKQLSVFSLCVLRC